jgi:hypothetical protein
MPERLGGVRPVGVGDVLHLRERDYRFGAGDLRLRVTVEPAESPEPGWMTDTGTDVRWNGEDGAERRVDVPVEVLQDARIRGAQPLR